MLAEHPVDLILLATDLPASRLFYHEVLGFEIVSESEDAVTVRAGGSSQIIVSASTTGTADAQTQASFRVTDLAAELAELRERGVDVLEYDEPGFTTVDGILDTGDMLHAWIVDPGGNCLGIDQQL